MKETNSSGTNDETLDFRNPDGSVASWLEPVSLAARRKILIQRTCFGLAISCLLWATQWKNGVFDLDHVWVGALPVIAFFIWGYGAYIRETVRRYTTTDIAYTQKDRLRRAGKWWAIGVACCAVIWASQYASDRLAEYWWYAWPMTAFFIVGAGPYLLKRERVLTPEALKAKSHYDAEQEKLKREGKLLSGLDVLLELPGVRYPLAMLSLYAAYYLSTESMDKRSGFAAVVFVLLGLYLAKEVSKWLLGFGAIFAIGWALIAGIAALPLSAAVIIGALIIASSGSRKS